MIHPDLFLWFLWILMLLFSCMFLQKASLVEVDRDPSQGTVTVLNKNKLSLIIGIIRVRKHGHFHFHFSFVFYGVLFDQIADCLKRVNTSDFPT